MITKVTVFLEELEKEGFGKRFAIALQSLGLDVKTVKCSSPTPETLKQLEKNPSDLTLAFHPINPLPDGKNLWEFLQTPHVQFLTTPLCYSLDIPESNYLYLASLDRKDVEIAKTSLPRILFFPLACENEDFSGVDTTEKDIDVVLFGHCFDFISYRKQWKQQLSHELSWTLDFAMDLALINSSITLTEALMSSLETAGLNKSFWGKNFRSLFPYFDKFMTGKDHFELLNAIKNASVDIYGTCENPTLKGQPNLTFHPPVDHSKVAPLLRRSKLCLISSPTLRSGASDIVFTALACGALPITCDNSYLEETLIKGEDILYYKANHWNRVNEWVDDLLNNDKKRMLLVSSGQQNVKRYHTWDQRAKKFIEDMQAL